MECSLTCAYAPHAPYCEIANGLRSPRGPAICCMRRSWRSFSESANFTTKLDDAPWKQTNVTVKGPFKCYITLFSWKLDPPLVMVITLDHTNACLPCIHACIHNYNYMYACMIYKNIFLVQQKHFLKVYFYRTRLIVHSLWFRAHLKRIHCRFWRGSSKTLSNYSSWLFNKITKD